MTLRAKCTATLRAGLEGRHMLLNLRGHHLLLQAREQRFSFCYSQSHSGRGDFLGPFDDPSSCSTELPGTASNTSLIVHL
jgi:hypothetical protein